MHRRVELKKSQGRMTIQETRGPLEQPKPAIIHGSASNEVLHTRVENQKKFKPLISALPRTLESPPTIAERIRAAKKLHMTRRDMTEQKIIRNILMHNDPKDMQNFEVLYITNKQQKLLHDQIYQEGSRNEFPSISHVTR